MIRFIKYLLIIINLIGLVYSYKAQTLEFYVKDESLNNYTLESQNKYSDTAEINNVIKLNQSSDLINGYVIAGYDSILYDTAIVKAYYNRGERYLWENIYISDELLVKSKLPKNSDEFNSNILTKEMKRLVNYYAENGFPFAIIKLDSLNFNKNLVTATIGIEKGDKYFIDSLIIKGTPKIKGYYISKTINIKKGDIFSISNISNIDRKIKAIPFVEQSRPYQLAFSEDRTDILFYLKNKKASNFSGLIGIMPNNQTSGKLLITGDINLYLLNSAGIGELFLFKWQKYESHSQNLKTKLSVPYLFKSDFGTDLSFDIEKKDSSYVNTDFIGSILYGSNTGNGIKMYYRKMSSYLLSTDNSENGISDFSTNSYGIGYRYLNTDNSFHPRKGWIVDVFSEFGSKNIADDSENAENILFQTRSQIDVSYFIPIGNFMSFKIRNFTSSVYSKIVLDNELYRLGGLNSIRGFDELSIPVSSFSLCNLELSYVFEEESALFAFIDGAYFEKRFTADDSYNYAIGTGIGLDLNTAAGTFTIVYAIGKQNDNNISFKDSKIHFGYRNNF
ncbi:MAG: BamA/TamA family outer membrane protein [Bacteroidales bacterium]|nr:BamA/TamA family outer membrane protein [Bacteroidales bacterium]